MSGQTPMSSGITVVSIVVRCGTQDIYYVGNPSGVIRVVLRRCDLCNEKNGEEE
jgi:hypothetical protein